MSQAPAGPSARRLAVEALIAVDGGARANVVVPELLSGCELDARDRALVTELAYGACRMQRACDWLTGRHTRGRLDPQIRAALRVGAYQLGWTRVPRTPPCRRRSTWCADPAARWSTPSCAGWPAT